MESFFDSGPDPRSKIQDPWEVFPRNLGSRTCPNHRNHFGIIVDSGPARTIGIIFDSGPSQIIGIMLESFLIRALPESSESFWYHFDSGLDPRSKIQDSSEVFPRNLGSSTCPNHPNHFGIILIRAGIQDPRFLGGLPKESWIQYLPESFFNHFLFGLGSKYLMNNQENLGTQ